ncbi:MAG TPA: hypothetical protein VJY62_14130, partial [Bacteroidia bacterium]|nr:hypothetical protein [Bacteroidia bacterium]
SIYELLKDPVFHILVFSRENSEQGKIASLENFSRQNYPGLFKIVLIAFNEENKEAFEKFGIKNLLICMVRPDNYAGYLNDKINLEEMKLYLEKQLSFNLSS